MRRSSTLSKAHFSATALAAQSSRDSGERYREAPWPWPGPGPGPRGAGRRQGRLPAVGCEGRGCGCSLRPSAMTSRSTLTRPRTATRKRAHGRAGSRSPSVTAASMLSRTSGGNVQNKRARTRTIFPSVSRLEQLIRALRHQI